MDDYETAESRVNGLKKILSRYNMNPDLFDLPQEHGEVELFNCFMSNTDNPFLDIKKNSHISKTLVTQGYIDGKLELKKKQAKKRLLKEQKQEIYDAEEAQQLLLE